MMKDDAVPSPSRREGVLLRLNLSLATATAATLLLGLN